MSNVDKINKEGKIHYSCFSCRKILFSVDELSEHEKSEKNFYKKRGKK